MQVIKSQKIRELTHTKQQGDGTTPHWSCVAGPLSLLFCCEQLDGRGVALGVMKGRRGFAILRNVAFANNMADAGTDMADVCLSSNEGRCGYGPSQVQPRTPSTAIGSAVKYAPTILCPSKIRPQQSSGETNHTGIIECMEVAEFRVEPPNQGRPSEGFCELLRTCPGRGITRHRMNE